ncbi:histidine phosphatase family protein [Lacinutrix sp. C3R15]|uniref:SixA phosphatase family protein n=1 Tax=Flavobacteriaceae TaxID=49546 RepID=UPI001C091A14|nr:MULTISPECIES: histidine phosphatase family protein [Flavobacteriaceae]MBU2940101.1 histidine phosphatase family protein [Lacinutrix sp. C3R15]MDO6623418.1 histidine phosphatase family protein [Oceanihabitans sp. 1_MG-2023]
MKKITIIRHAKSSWKYQVIDFERPLNERGLADAVLVSTYAKTKIFKPDLILSSDANRAKTTAGIFIKNLGFQEVAFQLNNKLYDFAGEDLIHTIKNCSQDINHLMLFGHNYAITSFVNIYGSVLYDNIPTSGLVSIEFDIDNWKKLIPGKTILKIFPKDLK